jgi:hypothetical protein
VRLVYDNADAYLSWRANHYLNLDEAMTEELDDRIASFMAWHRAQALPKYAQLAGAVLTARYNRQTSFGGTMPSSRSCEKACAQQQKKSRRSLIG